MGNAQGPQGGKQSRLGLSNNFTADEIRRLGKRFQKLDTDKSGAINRKEFMAVPDLRKNPIVTRIIDIFDTDKNGEIDFKEFIKGMALLSMKGDNTSKLKFAFRIYDVDGDGFISNGELFFTLKKLVGKNLEDAQLQQIVDKTIIYADKDRDGRISFDEFTDAVMGTEFGEETYGDTI